MNAFVPLVKPPGLTSHSTVARVRRALAGERAGHLGTLDPDAAGVLVVAVGDARRLLRYLPPQPKCYRGEFVFGTETTTGDDQGEVTVHASADGLTANDVERALQNFVGEQLQTPPLVSAVKVQGRRLHAYARADIPVDAPARAVTLCSARLEAFWPGPRPRARLYLETSSGYYVRSLARDMGRMLGSAAHLGFLLRLAVGHWRLEQAVTLAELPDYCPAPLAQDLGLPLRELSAADCLEIRHGRAIATNAESGLYALVREGALLAVAASDGEALRPRTVLEGAIRDVARS